MIYGSPSPSLPSPCPSSSLKPSRNNDDCERASGFMLSQSGRASEPTIFRCHCSNPPPHPSPSAYSPACQAPVPEKTLNVSVNLGFRVSPRFLSSALLNWPLWLPPLRFAILSFHAAPSVGWANLPPVCPLLNPRIDQCMKKEPTSVSCWFRADGRSVVFLSEWTCSVMILSPPPRLLFPLPPLLQDMYNATL